jgi:TolB-like protein/tRNA A-37 threonylcarbamoyl transferase component Bud32/tetratricopeptide (TPR) repeat protein
MTRAPGALLANRYEVEARLGRGGMGEVFRARDRSLGELVAVKSIVLDGSDAGATLRRFREEVRLARRVTHRNVARVFDLVEDADGGVFLTMELVLGITLKALLERDGPLVLRRAALIGVDVCAGLTAVHAAGIIHRDLKPTNILVEDTGRAVIADFGVARNTRDPTSLGLGAIVGTPSYMAPEQAVGKAVDSRADVYALGATLFEMFSGVAPRMERAERLATAPIPSELKAILAACLSPDPEDRPSPADVGEVLGLIADRKEADAPGPISGLAVVAPEAPRRAGEGPVDAFETTRSDVARLEATLASSKRRTETAIVVLPFRELGPPGPNALGEVVSGELTDVLSGTGGLRVLATSAAARFKDDRDPLRIGRELSVGAVIDGTLRIAGEDIRMSVRLIDAVTGSQLWTESFEGSLGDLFSFESIVARRVAEQLRARVLLMPYDSIAPAEAVRCYLDARVASKTPAGIGEMIRLLERALELSPDLSPALAALATASMTAWFVPFSPATSDWEQICARRVERALAGAPGLAETHVAHGLLAWERGRPQEAVSSLKKALGLAPTYAEALTCLGELSCRMGNTERGLSHSRLARNLDPTHFIPVVTMAREEAFSGRFHEAMACLDALGDMFSPPAFLLRVRAASWFGDEGEIRSCLARAWALSDSGGALAYGEVVARSFLGELEDSAMVGLSDALLAMGRSPRLSADVLAISVEVQAKAGRLDAALAYLERAAAIPAFVDTDWLERCPGLRDLRESAVYRAALETTRARVRAIAV